MHKFKFIDDAANTATGGIPMSLLLAKTVPTKGTFSLYELVLIP